MDSLVGDDRLRSLLQYYNNFHTYNIHGVIWQHCIGINSSVWCLPAFLTETRYEKIIKISKVHSPLPTVRHDEVAKKSPFSPFMWNQILIILTQLLIFRLRSLMYWFQFHGWKRRKKNGSWSTCRLIAQQVFFFFNKMRLAFCWVENEYKAPRNIFHSPK